MVCHLSNSFVGRILLLQFFSHWVFLSAFIPFKNYNEVLNDFSQGAWRFRALSSFWGQDLQLCAYFQDLRQPQLAHQETWLWYLVHSAVLREEQIYSFTSKNIITFLAGAVTCWNPIDSLMSVSVICAFCSCYWMWKNPARHRPPSPSPRDSQTSQLWVACDSEAASQVKWPNKWCTGLPASQFHRLKKSIWLLKVFNSPENKCK